MGWSFLRRRRASGAAPPGPIACALEALGEVRGRVTFVQIGSNDADHGDPLTPFVLRERWRGVMVEPVPYVFLRLEKRFGSREGIRLINAAVADCEGERDFHHLGESRDPLPPWYDQIGSFQREHLLKHKSHIPDVEERIVSVRVPCLTLAGVLRRAGLETCDLLHVDAEGCDDEIVGQVDLGTARPGVIIYEHLHLPPERREQCEARLRAAGYLLHGDGFNTVALDGRDSALRSAGAPRPPAWRRGRAVVPENCSRDGFAARTARPVRTLNRRSLLVLAPAAYPLGGVATWLDYLLPGLESAGWRAVLGLTAGRHHDTGDYLARHPWSETVLVANRTGSAQGRVNAVCDALRIVAPDMVAAVNLVDVYLAVRSMRSRGEAPPPTVMTLHGLQGDLLEDLGADADVIDGVIATNRLLCALAEERFGRPERVFYAPYGVVEHPGGGASPRGALAGPLRVLFCGRVDQSQKRVLDLAGILAALAARGTAATLTVVGAGPEESALRERCARLGVGSGVRFLGVLDGPGLAAQYLEHDALLVTSAWETGPIVAWEAMAHGLPFVSSRYVGSVREGALRSGVNCLTFPVGDLEAAADALLSLHDGATRARLVRGGRDLVGQRYSRERSVSQWLEALETIATLPPLPDPGPAPAAPAGRLDRVFGTSLGERLRRVIGLSHPHRGPGGEWPHTAHGEVDQVAFLARAEREDSAGFRPRGT